MENALCSECTQQFCGSAATSIDANILRTIPPPRNLKHLRDTLKEPMPSVSTQESLALFLRRLNAFGAPKAGCLLQRGQLGFAHVFAWAQVLVVCVILLFFSQNIQPLNEVLARALYALCGEIRL